MNETIELLNRIAHGVGGDWKELVLLDNPENTQLVDAYNQGVRAMAKAACTLVQGMLDIEVLKRELDEAGTKVTIERVGER